jgi:hypothetical protein
MTRACLSVKKLSDFNFRTLLKILMSFETLWQRIRLQRGRMKSSAMAGAHQGEYRRAGT